MQRNPNEDLIEIAKDVALRWCIHAEAGHVLSNLYVRVTRAMTWRTVLHSDQAAEKVLDQMESVGVPLPVVIDLTSTFLFRSGLVDATAREKVADTLAKSVTWVANAGELNKLIAGLSARDSNAAATFKTCPWMIFLYLFSMSDFMMSLEALKIPPAPPLAKQE